MNKTPPAKARLLNPEEVYDRVYSAYQETGSFINKHPNHRLRKLWTSWRSRLRDLLDRARQRPEVAISLVGGTGAGKSTLVNALIGAQVLPVGNVRACTAAVCEVSYMDGPYRARIEFLSRAAWQQEINVLLADLKDTHVPAEEDGSSDLPSLISRAVRDKLWTVYRPDEHDDPQLFDPFHLAEPPEIKAALDTGSAEIEYADFKDFRKHVRRYLDAQHRFWPIVKTVQIHGPFAPLRDGAKIIDLPGLNDPNAAREEVTKTHLKTCRFVWVVFNIRRALTRDIVNLMVSEDFTRQLVMDGRANSLTFVGTGADELDLDSAREEFHLSDDAPFLDVAAARNSAVRKAVFSQLDDVAFRLASRARESRETAARLSANLKSSKLVTVSAREYLRLSGLARTDPRGFEEPNQTQLPQLRDHMRRIVADYGVTAHCRSLNQLLDLILAEIQAEKDAQQAAHDSRTSVSERKRKELRAAVDAARSFLDGQLVNCREHLVQALEAAQALLAERIKLAVERARSDLDRTLARWGQIHPLTIRAVCRRAGTFEGAGGRFDFAADLSKPILDGIAFTWSDFFGQELRHTLEKWTNFLTRHALGFREGLAKTLPTSPHGPTDPAARVAAIFETTENILRELLAQAKTDMEGAIQHDQRTLYESVPQQVRANLHPAFQKAAGETGQGMRQRIVDILADHARQVSQVMFDDARNSLVNAVRGLGARLAREYDKMIDAVKRNAALAADNVVTIGERLTQDRLKAEEAFLNDFETLLGRLT
jgi:hypothetical protein